MPQGFPLVIRNSCKKIEVAYESLTISNIIQVNKIHPRVKSENMVIKVEIRGNISSEKVEGGKTQ